MLLRVAIFSMMSLGLVGFGTVGFLALRDPAPPPVTIGETSPPPAPVARRTVLVAAGPLRAGLLLKPEDLAPRELSDATADMQEDTPAVRAALNGAMLRRNLTPNDAVLAADVMRPGDRGFLAAILAPGKRAASVAVDAVSGSAGLIWPGDHVDLILTQSLDDPSLPAGRRVAAETVLTDVRVIAIDQLLARGVAPPIEQAGLGRTVTLEVTSAEAERIAVATRLGRLSLSIRAAEDALPANAPASLKTTWGSDVSPALTGSGPQNAGGATLRLYQGAADAKEIKF